MRMSKRRVPIRSERRPSWCAPVLGDVQLGQHLDSRDHRRHELGVDRIEVVDDTVDPDADEQLLAVRNEVDVACSEPCGTSEDLGHELDRGTLCVRAAARCDLELGRKRRVARKAVERRLDVVASGDRETERPATRHPELVERVEVGRVGDGDLDELAVGAEREGRCGKEQAPRQDQEDGFVEDPVAELDEGKAVLFCDCPCAQRADGLSHDRRRPTRARPAPAG